MEKKLLTKGVKGVDPEFIDFMFPDSTVNLKYFYMGKSAAYVTQKRIYFKL